MTRDEKIRKALEVLKPPSRQRAECQHDIELTLDMVEQRAAAARSFRMAGSKKGKAGLKRYHAALRRLRDAYRALDPAIKPWFSLAETAYVAGKATVIDREITMAEIFLAQRHGPLGAMLAGTKLRWRWQITCSIGGATRRASRGAGSGRSWL